MTQNNTITLEEFAETLIFPVGQPNDAYAQYFSGRSWLPPLTGEQYGQLS